MPESTHLNSEPKSFTVEFSTLMDRASVERALYANIHDPDSSRTLGIRFDWHSERKLSLKIARPRGRIIISFDGARGFDGRIHESLDYERLVFDAVRPQTIQRLDQQGRVLSQYPIAQTTLSDIAVLGDGPYAIAHQTIVGPDADWGFPALLKFEGGAAKLRFIKELIGGNWEAAPAFFGESLAHELLLRDVNHIILQTPEMLDAGRMGKIITRPRQHLPAAAMSPDGLRLALIMTPDQKRALELYIRDRNGRTLLHSNLPIQIVLGEVSFSPVWLGWLDGRRLLVEGLAPNGRGNTQYQIDATTGEAQPAEKRPYPRIRHFHPSAIAPLEAGGLWKNLADPERIDGIMAAVKIHWRLGRIVKEGRDHQVERLDLATGKPHVVGPGRLIGASAKSIWVVIQE